MTTRATTWAAQIAVVLALLLTSTASASSGFLTGNSCRGENSLEDGLHRGQASANAGTHRVCDEFCLTSAADSVVAPVTGPTPTDRLKEQLFERPGKPRSQSTIRGAETELKGNQVEAAIEQARTFDHVTKVRNAQRGLLNRIDQIKRQLGNAGLSEAEKAALQAELSEASRLLDMTEKIVPR